MDIKRRQKQNVGKGLNRGGDYHTQRNNAVDPGGTCNVTSYVMAAKRAGCVWPYADGEQPEDVFARFLCRQESIETLRSIAPWALCGDGTLRYKPYEVHALLAWGYNKLVTGGRAEFRTSWTLAELVCLLSHGAGVVVSGDFPHYRLGRIGHLVSVADVQYDGIVPDEPSRVDLNKLDALMMDDPYGDYVLGYNPRVQGYDKGNDVRMSRTDIFTILKNKTDEDGYWAHVLLRTSR